MTLGAVQPPGSKGDDVVHTRTHSQDSGDESDATMTFTEEDDMDKLNAIDDLEEEEERLIMNGGVGTPIGPVSGNAFPLCVFKATQDSIPRPLLPPLAPQHAGRKCLVYIHKGRMGIGNTDDWSMPRAPIGWGLA